MIRKLTTLLLNNIIRKSRLLTKILFGVKIIYNSKAHWDFTTLILKQALKDTINPNFNVLEIGTGPHAILSIYLAKRIKCNITASDINPEYVNYAINTASLNSANIKVIHSDLFTNIEGKFDIIFWNSMYIPRIIGEKIKMDRICQYRTDWCGGESGFESIEKFLVSAHGRLNEEGLILLGFNRIYLKEDEVISRCQSFNYSIESVTKRLLNPSCAIAVKKSRSATMAERK